MGGFLSGGLCGCLWLVGLWMAPWIGFRLGIVDGCGRGWVVVKGWMWVCLEMVGVVCWCGWFWIWVGFGVWGGPGSASGPNST